MTSTPPLTHESIAYTTTATIAEGRAGQPSRFVGELVRPVGLDAPARTLVLAHDWSGIHDGMRVIADRFAAAGWVACLLDVYGAGVRGDPLGDNHALMDPLLADRGALRRRLLAGFDAVLEHAAVDPSRVAALGFCFGGLCALDLARAAPRSLRAAISVHGVLAPPELGPQAPIDASILVLHGWEDPVAPPPAVLALAAELTAARADWQLHAYGHAQHAFTFPAANAPELGIVYEPRAARRAWATIDAFLDEVIGASSRTG
ncbi:MAG: dienelactone hydrolase family protein [Myxococcales bacterium]|nr:dienelactone hydrolase family protein [Myxococcales bacterium]